MVSPVCLCNIIDHFLLSGNTGLSTLSPASSGRGKDRGKSRKSIFGTAPARSSATGEVTTQNRTPGKGTQVLGVIMERCINIGIVSFYVCFTDIQNRIELKILNCLSFIRVIQKKIIIKCCVLSEKARFKKPSAITDLDVRFCTGNSVSLPWGQHLKQVMSSVL